MKLGQKQELFSSFLPILIIKAHDLGFDVRVGDLFRDPRVHGAYGEKVGYSSAYSMHKLKLAVDLNLFINNVLKVKTSDFQVLGEWWEQQHELCRWGGRFKDGNHFSLTHDGRA